MKTFLTTLSVLLTVLVSPVSFDDWRTTNTFSGGFEGFADYYTWLTPENRATYLETGDFSEFGDFEDQTSEQWRAETKIGETRGFQYYVK